MAPEWQTTTVRQLVVDGVLERPIDGNHGEIHPKTGDFVRNGIPFIMASDLVNGRVDTAHCAFISEQQARILRKGFAKPGDVLISHKATMGRTAIVGELDTPFLVLTPQVTYYRVKDPTRLSNRYLKLYFDSPSFQQLFETWGHKGSTRAYLGITSQLDLPVTLPPPDEQRAIAHILGTLDDKIELNRRMNETLEAMARALFKSWFVDFDPVRAKAEGRDPSLPKPLADLFPDSFEDSEMGEIPKGWAVKPLRDLTGYLSRGIGPAYIETGGICVLNQKCVRDRRIDFAKARRHDPEKKPTVGRLLQRLDVLVNSTGVGTLGRVAQLWHLPEQTIVDSHVSVLRAAPGVDPWFFGAGVTGREVEIMALGEGSTGQTELSRARLGDLACLAPPSEVQKQFGLAAARFLGRLSNAQQESERLGALRDALLPKLISGELRVKDPERFIGRAT